MIDESFRWTPVDVRKKEFPRALRGYDAAEVEAFRGQVAEELERLIRQNLDLDGKVKNLIEQLRAYRERDKALNDALISAQQLRSEIREQADREAQLILREARAEGERVVDQARGEVRLIEAEVSSLARSRRSLIGQIRALLERQLQELEAIEATLQPPEHPATGDPAAGESGRQQRKTPAWLDSLVSE